MSDNNKTGRESGASAIFRMVSRLLGLATGRHPDADSDLDVATTLNAQLPPENETQTAQEASPPAPQPAQRAAHEADAQPCSSDRLRALCRRYMVSADMAADDAATAELLDELADALFTAELYACVTAAQLPCISAPPENAARLYSRESDAIATAAELSEYGAQVSALDAAGRAGFFEKLARAGFRAVWVDDSVRVPIERLCAARRIQYSDKNAGLAALLTRAAQRELPADSEARKAQLRELIALTNACELYTPRGQLAAANYMLRTVSAADGCARIPLFTDKALAAELYGEPVALHSQKQLLNALYFALIGQSEVRGVLINPGLHNMSIDFSEIASPTDAALKQLSNLQKMQAPFLHRPIQLCGATRGAKGGEYEYRIKLQQDGYGLVAYGGLDAGAHDMALIGAVPLKALEGAEAFVKWLQSEHSGFEMLRPEAISQQELQRAQAAAQLNVKLMEQRADAVSEIRRLDALYALCLGNYPLSTESGEIKLYTRMNRAEADFDGLLPRGEAQKRFTLRTLPADGLNEQLQQWQQMGMSGAFIDPGLCSARLTLAGLSGAATSPLVDSSNVELRFELLRLTQLFAQLALLRHGSGEGADALRHSLANTQLAAYRLLGKALIILPAQPIAGAEGKTLYTTGALEKAQELLIEKGLSAESLLLRGTDGYQVYDGQPEFNRGAINTVGGHGLSVCEAYTLWYGDEAGRTPIVATFDEAIALVKKCDLLQFDPQCEQYIFPVAEAQKVHMISNFSGSINIAILPGGM